MDDLVELNRQTSRRFRMTEEQVPARFKIFKKTLDQLRTTLVAEINHHVHAENAVETSHVGRLRKVDGRERHHVANLRLDHELFADFDEVVIHLSRRKILKYRFS